MVFSSVFFPHSAAKPSLDEFHAAVAVVTGSTIRMAASLARLGKA